MASKASEFHRFVLKSLYSVYIICETSFHPDICSTEFFPSDYMVYRCDRSDLTSAKVSGGGILIAVHSSIPNEQFHLAPSSVEHLCIKITINKKKLYIYGAYIPPDSDSQKYRECCEAIAEICNASDPSDLMLVTGDFNLTNIKWTFDNETDSLLPYNVSAEHECLFIDTVLQSNLNQINAIANGRGRYLDLILTNESNVFNINESLDPFVQNDINHKALEISSDTNNLNLSGKNHVSNNIFYNFKKMNSENFKQYLNAVNWTKELKADDINNNVGKFYDLMSNGFEIHVPLSINHPNTYPPWYDETLINLKNRKSKEYRKMKKTSLERDRTNYLKVSKEYDNYFELRYRQYILNVQEKIKSNPKYFWNFYKSKREIQGYPATMNYMGSKSTNSEEIANLFADFFQSVYKVEDIDSYTNPTGCDKSITISIPDITEDDIIDALKSFRDGCGPDGIPSSVLKICANELKKPLSIIFNRSLKTGIFPSNWKITKITPIFKSGNRDDISCYRGIVSISSIPKLFEKLVCSSFNKIVPGHISIHQHGFMPSRSTSTNLIEFTSRTINAIEDHYQIDTIYTDFSKAFDSISHRKALESLYNFGFSNQFVIWVRSYLANRVQYVEIGGKKSKTVKASSGVPQGSHIGPWIFIIFIDGVKLAFQNSKILMFADDLKIYHMISNTADTLLLQNDINRLYDWCNINQIELNISKCKVMSFHRKVNPVICNYHINNTSLQRVTENKDLGVIFVENMTFNKHIDLCIAKANAMFGFIKRWSKDISEQRTLLILYFAYIRSQLEYAVNVWCPHYANSNKRIESVQKKFVLYIFKKNDWDYDDDLPYYENVARLPPYSTRCHNLCISTLESRRRLLGSSLIGNTLLGFIDSPFILENIKLQVPSRNLRQQRFLHLDVHRTNYGENEPINQMAKFFNSVDHLFEFGITKNSFKKNLKNHFLNKDS